MRPAPWMKSNQVQFEFPRYVNKVDIRNYLQSLYGVQVLKVDTVVGERKRIAHPRPFIFHKHPTLQPYMWETMRKRAIVTIEGTFSYPPVLKDHQDARDKKQADMKAEIDGRIKQIQLFRDNWDEVVKERYMGMEPLPDPMCELPAAMDDLKLDDLTLVKGSAKTRVHLNEKGKPRKPGKV
jgi:hypothetical protein